MFIPFIEHTPQSIYSNINIISHRMLEVEHPAAKVLVELAQLQDEEVGDGTTSVVIIAAELLKVKISKM